MKTKIFTLFAAVVIAANAMADTKTITVKDVSFDMILVEGGTFTMGGTSEQGSDVNENEKITHSVTLSNYYIGKTEVTQALWYAVMGQKPTLDGYQWNDNYGLGDSYPAYYTSWEDCQSFITKLNELTGLNFRMPTEAEWEYAARGGNKSQGYKYSGSNTLDGVALYGGNDGSKEVGAKAANELGLYDMSGNVYEWCSDWYEETYSDVAQTDPTGPASGTNRILRGGCWSSPAENCRVSYRLSYLPSNRNLTGLRLASAPIYTITATAGEKGNVSGSGLYTEGGEAKLTVTPKTGYAFSKWSDDNTENPRIVKVTQDSTFTAEFAIVHTAGVALDATTLELSVGASKQLTAAVSPANALNQNITWITTDASVATVENGLVKAISAGAAAILVQTEEGGYLAWCNVQVTNGIEGISLNETSLELSVGSAVELTTTITAPEAAYKAVNWTTSNAEVAKVENGWVTAVSAGVAAIGVATVDGGFVATCAVTVKAAGPTTEVQQVAANPSGIQKVLVDGVLYIVKPNGERYLVDGRKVK